LLPLQGRPLAFESPECTASFNHMETLRGLIRGHCGSNSSFTMAHTIQYSTTLIKLDVSPSMAWGYVSFRIVDNPGVGPQITTSEFIVLILLSFVVWPGARDYLNRHTDRPASSSPTGCCRGQFPAACAFCSGAPSRNRISCECALTGVLTLSSLAQGAATLSVVRNP
jgi:hypothetical protein